MHGVPVVKTALCHARDSPAPACTWISPKADPCPHWEQEPSSSRVLPYTETCKSGVSHVLECQTFSCWGSLGKCSLWLLLPSPQIHLDQPLVAYPFLDLISPVQRFCRIPEGLFQCSSFFPRYVMALWADLSWVVGWRLLSQRISLGQDP